MVSKDLLDQYQKFVDDTCVHRDHTYPFLGLAGECGEVMEQVKKAWRVHKDAWALSEERVFKIQDELGDVLWYLTRCADVMGLSLEELMEANMEKLNERNADGK